jgi:hypothetical protein
MKGIRIYDERRDRLFSTITPRMPKRIGAPASRPGHRPLDIFIECLLTPFEGLYETGALVLETMRKGFECVVKVFEALEVFELIASVAEACCWIVGAIVQLASLFC